MNEPIARIRIELQNTDPAVWRRVDVPLSSTLMSLHHIIQLTVGWTNCHLFEFRVGDRSYGEPVPYDVGWKPFKAKNTRLQMLVDRGTRRFTYLYDFGDSWEHDIVIEEIRTGDANIDYPAFVDGANRCPPEDVGGFIGYKEFLEAALNPGHKDHNESTAWYESRYYKRFDPDDIDLPRIRTWLAEFARRRRGPLLRHRTAGRGRTD